MVLIKQILFPKHVLVSCSLQFSYRNIRTSDDSEALSVPKAGSDLARIITSDVYIDVMALIENSVYER